MNCPLHESEKLSRHRGCYHGICNIFVISGPTPLNNHYHYHHILIILVWADGIDGGGWTLVRHVPSGNNWYSAADHLTGTAEYGTPAGETSEKEFSVRFDNTNFSQFLFATGREGLYSILNL